MTPVELLPPGVGPEDERWHQHRRAGISASEIAAVMGISPWESPFSLYWRKANDWRGEDTDLLSTGRLLEAPAADWWAQQHPYITVAYPAGLYAHPDRPWQLATPDRNLHLACVDCGGRGEVGKFYDPCEECDGSGIGILRVGLLECKWVAYSWDGWGQPGTDDIPVHYRAQALWQLDVLGVDEVHFAALGPGGFRAYGPIRRDDTDLAVMRKAGEEFVWRLRELVPPDLDGHTATLGALRRLHPTVGDGDVEVPVDLAEEYRQARADKATAQARIDECEARLRAALGGTYARTTCGGKLVASRSVYDRKPYEVGPATIDKLNPGRTPSYA